MQYVTFEGEKIYKILPSEVAFSLFVEIVMWKARLNHYLYDLPHLSVLQNR